MYYLTYEAGGDLVIGNPRILHFSVLVVEFESRRDEILNLFAKYENDQLLRAPSVCRHNSTRVDEGRKS